MSEWDRRELCPDGGCVGVIGKDGKCNVCGRAGEASGLRPQASGEEVDEYEDEHEHDQEPEQASGQSPKPKAQSPVVAAGADEWDQRQLCADGACIGVIEDGKCNVCGKAPE